MIGFPWEVLKGLRRFKEMKRMNRSAYVGTRAIATAVAAVADHRVQYDEQAWIDKIETLRDKLASQTDRATTVVDYGAGNPGDDLTTEEMTRGRSVTRTIAEICESGNLPYRWRLLLFHLIRSFKPSSCIELGTSLGISAAFQTAALELNKYGRLVTLEGSETLAAIARENLETLGLERAEVQVGRFEDTLHRILGDYAPIDHVFIDGHHEEKATIGYYEQMLPHLAEEALVVFDDILWYEGMQRAWKRITKYRQVRVAVDLGVVGVCIVSEDADLKERYSLSLVDWSAGGGRGTAEQRRSVWGC